MCQRVEDRTLREDASPRREREAPDPENLIERAAVELIHAAVFQTIHAIVDAI